MPVFELDHAHTAGRDDQEIYLAYMPGVRGEGEVRPSPPRVRVRQLLADGLQAAALMVKLGLGDRRPPAFPHAHTPLPDPDTYLRPDVSRDRCFPAAVRLVRF